MTDYTWPAIPQRAATVWAKRRWKHPFHVDTYVTLDAAREALPHGKFRRVLVGDVVKHPTLLEPVYEVVAPKRHR